MQDHAIADAVVSIPASCAYGEFTAEDLKTLPVGQDIDVTYATSTVHVSHPTEDRYAIHIPQHAHMYPAALYASLCEKIGKDLPAGKHQGNWEAEGKKHLQDLTAEQAMTVLGDVATLYVNSSTYVERCAEGTSARKGPSLTNASSSIGTARVKPRTPLENKLYNMLCPSVPSTLGF